MYSVMQCASDADEVGIEEGCKWVAIPDSKVHGANMGPIWDRQDSDGPHVDPMNLAIGDMS